jgi:hypothetical protein
LPPSAKGVTPDTSGHIMARAESPRASHVENGGTTAGAIRWGESAHSSRRAARRPEPVS